jgi:hypothetical protein
MFAMGPEHKLPETSSRRLQPHIKVDIYSQNTETGDKSAEKFQDDKCHSRTY